MNKHDKVLKKLKGGALLAFELSELTTLRRKPREKIWYKYHPLVHNMLHPRRIAKMRENLLPYFNDKSGICIGGVLYWKFGEYLKSASQLINVDSVAFFSGKPTYADYLTDATNLYFAKDNEFDFLCSSHVLEHVANPIKALKEWMRVVKRDGVIYCGVPDKRFTADHKRKITTLRHLINDYRSDIGPYDITHLWDIFNNVDLSVVGPTRAPETRENCFNFIFQYIMSGHTPSSSGHLPSSAPHHHVYTKEDLVALFKYIGLEIVFIALIGNTIHIVAQNKYGG